MYEFCLPKGAIVEILNNRYVHIGEGRFTGHIGTERPNLIEGVSDLPELESGTVVLTPTKDTTEIQNRFRVDWTAGTEDELIA